MAFERDGFNRQGFVVRRCSSGLKLGCGCRRFQNPGSTPDDRKQGWLWVHRVEEFIKS